MSQEFAWNWLKIDSKSEIKILCWWLNEKLKTTNKCQIKKTCSLVKIKLQGTLIWILNISLAVSVIWQCPQHLTASPLCIIHGHPKMKITLTSAPHKTHFSIFFRQRRWWTLASDHLVMTTKVSNDKIVCHIMYSSSTSSVCRIGPLDTYVKIRGSRKFNFSKNDFNRLNSNIFVLRIFGKAKSQTCIVSIAVLCENISCNHAIAQIIMLSHFCKRKTPIS